MSNKSINLYNNIKYYIKVHILYKTIQSQDLVKYKQYQQLNKVIADKYNIISKKFSNRYV